MSAVSASSTLGIASDEKWFMWTEAKSRLIHDVEAWKSTFAVARSWEQRGIEFRWPPSIPGKVDFVMRGKIGSGG
jgi:hypothetical protein